MSMRKIAFFVGLFAMVVGWLTYDSEVSTALVPIVTGAVVVVLAVLGLIPEFTDCAACGKKNLKNKKLCIHCGEKMDS
jgi:recombinational DNA repair protein (RecF pathway)